jgi:hypothetical protein
MFHVSWLNYFIHYRALSNTFKINSLHCNMYSKWHSSKDFKCCSSNLPHHYLTSGCLLEFMYVSYHLSFPSHSFRLILMFFNWCRVSILHRPVTHNRTSSTTHREVVEATPTIQMTTALLDWLYCCKLCDWLLCCKLCDGCIVLTSSWLNCYICPYVKICSWGSAFFWFFLKKQKFLTFVGWP